MTCHELGQALLDAETQEAYDAALAAYREAGCYDEHNPPPPYSGGGGHGGGPHGG